MQVLNWECDIVLAWHFILLLFTPWFLYEAFKCNASNRVVIGNDTAEIIALNQEQAPEIFDEENHWHLNMYTVEHLVAFRK